MDEEDINTIDTDVALHQRAENYADQGEEFQLRVLAAHELEEVTGPVLTDGDLQYHLLARVLVVLLLGHHLGFARLVVLVEYHVGDDEQRCENCKAVGKNGLTIIE